MKYYYTVTSLPSLPHPGAAPEMTPSGLLTHCQSIPDAEMMLQAVFERAALIRDAPLEETKWFAYFAALSRLGRQMKCRFLRELAAFELTLAKALEAARFKRTPALRPPVERIPETQAAPRHQNDADEFAARWQHSEEPMAGYRALLNARRQWTAQNGDWFSFGIDEIISYGAALLIAMEEAVLKGNLPLSALEFSPPVRRWHWSERT